MKLKNAAVVAAALALAVGMTACGSSSSSTAASSTASSVASSVAASSEAASSEAAVEPAEYTVYNTTGSTVSELYLYVAGSEDKGENLAGEGLADGENVVLTLPEDADQSAKYVLEFTTEDGTTILPVSKVSFGFASAGTDFDGKNAANKDLFGGGSGAGVNIQPVAFLVIKDGCVRTIQLTDGSNSVDRALAMLPELVEKVSALVSKKGEKPADEAPKAE